MLGKWLLILLLGCHLTALRAQSLELYERHVYTSAGDSLPYRLLLPADYNPSKKYPLVLFLHGAGERGSDNVKQLTHGAALFLKQEYRQRYPAIVVFPQCPQSSYWSNVQIEGLGNQRKFQFIDRGEPTPPMHLLMALTRALLTRYKIQKQQVYVMGLSMGGMGCFELVNRMPGVFAAAVPICGGAHPATAPNLKKTKWWVFHGAKDDVVPPRYSEQMVAALKQHKVPVRFTLFPDANHNSWDPAFATPGLLPWLFSQRRGGGQGFR